METNLKLAMAKFDVGDGLNDEELDLLIDFYTTTTENIQLLGSEFSLARMELYRRLDRLAGFKWAREHS